MFGVQDSSHRRPQEVACHADFAAAAAVVQGFYKGIVLQFIGEIRQVAVDLAHRIVWGKPCSHVRVVLPESRGATFITDYHDLHLVGVVISYFVRWSQTDDRDQGVVTLTSFHNSGGVGMLNFIHIAGEGDVIIERARYIASAARAEWVGLIGVVGGNGLVHHVRWIHTGEVNLGNAFSPIHITTGGYRGRVSQFGAIGQPSRVSTI